MRRDEFLNMQPIWGEDFERQYGSVDYRGKRVLDVGADYGSSAAFFLRKGASQVIAIEGDNHYFQQLKDHVQEVPEVIAIECWVNSALQFEELIETYRPHVVQVDCEGCEAHLFNVETRTLQISPEYLIEVHSPELLEGFKTMCSRLGYKIVSTSNLWANWWTTLWILHAMSDSRYIFEKTGAMRVT